MTEKTSKKIFWLRLSYWIGATADAVAAVAMLCPSLIVFAYKIEGFTPGTPFKYAMGLGAALMFGWTALLIWADRKPLERKGVLLLTIFPVIAGLILAEIFAVSSNFIKINEMIPTWIFQVVLISLFVFSYFKARN